MRTQTLRPALCALLLTMTTLAAPAAPVDTGRGDRLLAEYFRTETERLAHASLADVRTADDWNARRERERDRLKEMLGLDPWPEKTPLNAQVTGITEHAQFRVERLHFQSRPGLYVTGNLYVPKGLKGRAPAVLYVCGHGNVKENGVSYGSKAAYQHHGGWFARNGYVCLILDTLQLGEIEGLHHGTYREGMWWWNSRGYTPAGVEAWNCVRALDYLETRPEVDATKFGVTGRSGGGAYSWWIAAIDERIQAAVPVAGITDLTNHVVDGTVEGHCDCMFMVNTYRWDYAQVAALVAPRALLLANTDKDRIFPLEGIVRVHAGARKIYNLLGAGDHLGLLITEGPHKDTQDLQVPAMHWFNRFLKGEDPLLETAAVKYFPPKDLKVFATLPSDERNTRIHETFVPAAHPPVPNSRDEWTRHRDAWMQAMREKSFHGWAAEGAALDLRPVFQAKKEDVQLSAWDFTSQEHVPLRLYVAHRAGLDRPDLVVLNVVSPEAWRDWIAEMLPAFAGELRAEAASAGLPEPDVKGFEQTRGMFRSFKWAMAYVAPRGVGLTAWDASDRKQVQNRRRFMLLGQTLDGMRVWDIRRAMQAIRSRTEWTAVPLWLQGSGEMGVNALYASLFEPPVARLDLHDLPRSHRSGPDYLNVLRFLDVPQAVAMAAERTKLKLYQTDDSGWDYPRAVVSKLGWDAGVLDVRKPR